MKKFTYLNILVSIVIIASVPACKKDFLDKKPSSSLIVPTTLDDFERLLDDYVKMNVAGSLSEISSDNYYFQTLANWQAKPVYHRNAYLWNSDIYEGTGNIPDWNTSWLQILNSNIVLDGLKKIDRVSTNLVKYDFIKGWALYQRSWAYFNLAQLFSPPYDQSTANNDLGLPLNLEADVTITLERASVLETYNQIISDLTNSADLLPNSIQTQFRNRPCRPAALGLLARIYLSMREYEKALENVQNSLNLYDSLMDFNDFSITFPRTHKEVLWQAELTMSSTLNTALGSTTIIDSTLFASYNTGDLRNGIYFRLVSQLPRLYRYYSGVANPFCGIATDELYLIKAECFARRMDVVEAITALNKLLSNRFTHGSFSPISASLSQPEALSIILKERRKELPFRGLRWQDLRRLNKENAGITLTRILNGQTYTLAPNGPLYVLPIPPDEIQLSGIQQNHR